MNPNGLSWWHDRTNRILFRFSSVGFSAIFVSAIIYDSALPIFGHDLTILYGSLSGIVISIILQVLIYKIMKRKNLQEQKIEF